MNKITEDVIESIVRRAGDYIRKDLLSEYARLIENAIDTSMLDLQNAARVLVENRTANMFRLYRHAKVIETFSTEACENLIRFLNESEDLSGMLLNIKNAVVLDSLNGERLGTYVNYISEVVDSDYISEDGVLVERLRSDLRYHESLPEFISKSFSIFAMFIIISFDLIDDIEDRAVELLEEEISKRWSNLNLMADTEALIRGIDKR